MNLLVMINLINGDLTSITRIVKTDMLQRNRPITQNMFITFFLSYHFYSISPNESLGSQPIALEQPPIRLLVDA